MFARLASDGKDNKKMKMISLRRSMIVCLLSAFLVVLPLHSFERSIYPPVEAAKGDIASAINKASAEKKNILLDFGGDWCGDCQALDIYMHRPESIKILDANFILVHINVGHIDANLDVAEKYGIPLNKGVPALAVLDSHGKLLYSQKNGEFESMRRMDPDSVHRFLIEWKPTRPCSVVLVNC
jgi:thiol-disulfide isomerase/thioredoxin